MILVNALRGVRARVTMPKTGAWTVDVDVDLDTVPVAPTGPALVALGTNILRGTIDDRATGRFGLKAMVRAVAGGGGWDTPVPALDYHNDAAVLSTEVYTTTAATVGETVVELGPPKVLGNKWERLRGAASKVFDGVDWFVDVLGVTRVGPRIPLPAPPDAEVLEWDATNKVATIASDTLIVPGMTLTDPVRFGVVTVDDVSHVFDDGGARATAWCSSPGAPTASTVLGAARPVAGGNFVQGIAAIARQACQVDRLKRYAYRVIVQGVDKRVNLQSVDLTAECPLYIRFADLVPGVAGVEMKLAPASIVHVVFVGGRPVVVGFDKSPAPPLEVACRAVRNVFGPSGASPAAKADQVLLALSAICAAAGPSSSAMEAALAPFLPTIPSLFLFTD